jgi:uncharacterized protein (DUF1697 family)
VVPTATHVALLRGVNVGKSGRVSMAALTDALRLDGIAVASTVIQSGNLVVRGFQGESPELAQRIESSIERRLHLTARCLVRTDAQLRRLIDADPLGRSGDDLSRYLAHLCDPPLSAAAWRDISREVLDPANSAHRLGSVVQWCPRGVSNEQALSSLIERRSSSAVTARNWRTLRALLERCAGP